LATVFVVLEATAAATCPQIAASAVLEAAATAPCTRSAVWSGDWGDPVGSLLWRPDLSTTEEREAKEEGDCRRSSTPPTSTRPRRRRTPRGKG